MATDWNALHDAGGRRDVQTCYLYAGITAVSPMANIKQPRFGAPRHPAVRYTPHEEAVIVESGTKDPDALPKALYGCPTSPALPMVLAWAAHRLRAAIAIMAPAMENADAASPLSIVLLH